MFMSRVTPKATMSCSRALAADSRPPMITPRLCRSKHPNQAAAAITRKLLVTLWYVLSGEQAYKHSNEEELAYKMLSWAWHIDKEALNGMSRQQFTKYGLIRLGKEEQLIRIVRSGCHAGSRPWNLLSQTRS